VGILIDTSVFVAVERGRLDLRQFLDAFGKEELALAAVSASELLHGVHRAVQPAQRARREAFVERVLDAVPVIPFDLVVARVHAGLSARLALEGQPVGAHDLQIAATALAVGSRVVTSDARSFPRITGLDWLEWSASAPPGT